MSPNGRKAPNGAGSMRTTRVPVAPRRENRDETLCTIRGGLAVPLLSTATLSLGGSLAIADGRPEGERQQEGKSQGANPHAELAWLCIAMLRSPM